jgi:hypothetical protein
VKVKSSSPLSFVPSSILSLTTSQTQSWDPVRTSFIRTSPSLALI